MTDEATRRNSWGTVTWIGDGGMRRNPYRRAAVHPLRNPTSPVARTTPAHADWNVARSDAICTTPGATVRKRPDRRARAIADDDHPSSSMSWRRLITPCWSAILRSVRASITDPSWVVTLAKRKSELGTDLLAERPFRCPCRRTTGQGPELGTNSRVQRAYPCIFRGASARGERGERRRDRVRRGFRRGRCRSRWCRRRRRRGLRRSAGPLTAPRSCRSACRGAAATCW